MEQTFKFISADSVRQILPVLPDITYLPEYALFKERYYGLHSGIGVWYNRDGKLYAAVPVQYSDNEIFISHRDYTEPYRANADITILWQDEVIELRHKFNLPFVQFRFAFPSLQPGDSGILLDRFSTFVFYIKSDESDDDLMKRFDKKTRNELRRAKSSGFTIKYSGAETLPDLLDLYYENMKRHGTPPKSDLFFQELFKCFKTRLIVITLWRDSILAGANIIICGDRNARLLLNLSKQEYWPQYVNNLLYWETIQYAMINKLDFIDLGGSANRDVTHNHFKLGFGARMVPLFGMRSGTWRRHLYAWIASKKRHLVLRLIRLKKIKTSWRVKKNESEGLNKTQDKNNQIYNNDQAVKMFMKDGLFPAEQKIVDAYLKKGMHILDLGCGTGRTTAHLFRLDDKIVGVDYSESMIKMAHERLPLIDFRVADARMLPFADDGFDAVIFSFNGLDYLYPNEERIRALTEVRRVLRKGGFFIFSSHNRFRLPVGRVRLREFIKNLIAGRLFSGYRWDNQKFGQLLTYFGSVGSGLRNLGKIGFEFSGLFGSKYGGRMMISLFESYTYYVFSKK